MVSLFNVLGLIFWLLGLGACGIAKTPVDSNSGLLMILIGTVFLVGASIADELHHLRPAKPIAHPGPGDMPNAKDGKRFRWSDIFG